MNKQLNCSLCWMERTAWDALGDEQKKTVKQCEILEGIYIYQGISMCTRHMESFQAAMVAQQKGVIEVPGPNKPTHRPRLVKL